MFIYLKHVVMWYILYYLAHAYNVYGQCNVLPCLSFLLSTGQMWGGGGGSWHMHYLANIPGLEHFLAKEPPSGHNHYLTDVPGLQHFLAKDPPSRHKHKLANVPGLEHFLAKDHLPEHEHFLAYQREVCNKYLNCLLALLQVPLL